MPQGLYQTHSIWLTDASALALQSKGPTRKRAASLIGRPTQARFQKVHCAKGRPGEARAP